MPAKRVKRWSIGRNKERLKKKKKKRGRGGLCFVTVGKEADRRRHKPEEGKEGKKRKKATERERNKKREKKPKNRRPEWGPRTR